MNKEKMTLTLQPLAGGSFINWLKLLRNNGGVERKYIMRAVLVSVVSLLGIPFRFFETVKFGKTIENVQIQLPPIFIVGHWRSGTTFLHNLMAQDKNIGYVSTCQTWIPEMFLSSQHIWKIITSKAIPKKRPMDNVLLSSDLPQEEEYAIGNISQYSFYHGFFFPKNIKKYFRNFVLFEGVSEEIKNEWKKIYIKVLKKTTLSVNGKRLVIKNPANTARIKLLLEIFPNAKFIHIYRNPYIVYTSTKHLYQKLLPEFILQDIDEKEMEVNIINFYQDLMQKFFIDKNLIPPDNYVEIKYEDFVGNEISELKRVYEQLNLPNFLESVENFKQYIDSQSGYETNKYSFDEETIKKVYDSWKFTIDKWQYNPPSSEET
ncbi:MAG: sulfotransferase [Stigonema ocellatum SAG 48.90 = DSM 106950]|nr:sulfotransferase [Stigonema ocellatum SAG 48.90 = DSM 106950]